MPNRPTLIVLADCASVGENKASAGTQSSHDSAAAHFAHIGEMLKTVADSRLPVIVVTSAEWRDWAEQKLGAHEVVTLPPTPATASRSPNRMGAAIAAGVLASSQAPGWLLMPAHMPLLQQHTLDSIADAIGSHPVVYPRYGQQRGYPLGFSSEFFSELIRLEYQNGLDKLIARYPSHGVDTNDPGVLGRM